MFALGSRDSLGPSGYLHHVAPGAWGLEIRLAGLTRFGLTVPEVVHSGSEFGRDEWAARVLFD
jgi:hypothetical protein